MESSTITPKSVERKRDASVENGLNGNCSSKIGSGYHGYGVLKWPIYVLALVGLFHFVHGPHKRQCIGKISVIYCTIMSILTVLETTSWIYVYVHFSHFVAEFTVFFMSVRIFENAVNIIYLYILCWKRKGIHFVIGKLQDNRKLPTPSNIYLFTFVFLFVSLGYVTSLYVYHIYIHVLKDPVKNMNFYGSIFPFTDPEQYKVVFCIGFWFLYFSSELTHTLGTVIPAIYSLLLKREFSSINKTFQVEVERNKTGLFDAICQLR